jgi:hypothetical protein
MLSIVFLLFKISAAIRNDQRGVNAGLSKKVAPNKGKIAPSKNAPVRTNASIYLLSPIAGTLLSQ